MTIYYPLYLHNSFSKLFSAPVPHFSTPLSSSMFTRPNTPVPVSPLNLNMSCPMPLEPPILVRQDATFNIWTQLWDQVNDEIVVHSITIDNYNDELQGVKGVSDFYYKSMKMYFLPSTIKRLSVCYNDMKEYCRNPLPHLLQRTKTALRGVEFNLIQQFFATQYRFLVKTITGKILYDYVDTYDNCQKKYAELKPFLDEFVCLMSITLPEECVVE